MVEPAPAEPAAALKSLVEAKRHIRCRWCGSVRPLLVELTSAGVEVAP